MLTINNKDVAAAQVTPAVLREQYEQCHSYLELRQTYGYDLYEIMALYENDDKFMVAINENFDIALSMSAYDRYWRLWNHKPTLAERRGRYWK